MAEKPHVSSNDFHGGFGTGKMVRSKNTLRNYWDGSTVVLSDVLASLPSVVRDGARHISICVVDVDFRCKSRGVIIASCTIVYRCTSYFDILLWNMTHLSGCIVEKRHAEEEIWFIVFHLWRRLHSLRFTPLLARSRARTRHHPSTQRYPELLIN
jgi:hypothetical protein